LATFNAGLKFFLDKHAAKNLSREDYVSRVTGHYRMGLHDQTIREAYIKFICQHPLIVLDAHWCKLKTLMWSNMQFLREHMRYLLWVFLLCLPYAALEQYGRDAFKMKHLLYACIYMIIGSGIPYLYAYPSHLCGDHSIIIGIFCVIAATCALIAIGKMAIIKGITLYRVRET
jgi:hypothetical protein